MSLLATRQDFEPANPEEGTSALYYDPQNGNGYSSIMANTFIVRVNALKQRFAPNGQKLAIWGCGFGDLVQLAVDAGYDAFGYDASQYAIDRAKALHPGISSRVFLRNALVSNDMTPARRDAGLQGGQRFALLVTEDLLDCMSDAEIAVTLPLLRGICTANLLHIVTVPNMEPLDPRINWKTAAEWKALLSPPDVVALADGTVI